MIAEKEQTTTELILAEFDKAKVKTKFIKHIAEKFDRNAQGVRNNWFYGLQIFPKDLQEQILIECKNFNNGNTNQK